MSKRANLRKSETISSSRKRIWVTDFPEYTLKEELWELFRPFGDIDSISIVSKFPKLPMAFIDMKNSSDAQRAIRDLDKQIFQGRSITVRESKQKFYGEKSVYALLSFDKCECYIGETCDTKRRFEQHLNGKGDASSSPWILTLKDGKPKPIILEIVKPGYDTRFQASFLEAVWCFVADRCYWKAINLPFFPEVREELESAVKARVGKWFEILNEASATIFNP